MSADETVSPLVSLVLYHILYKPTGILPNCPSENLTLTWSLVLDWISKIVLVPNAKLL